MPTLNILGSYISTYPIGGRAEIPEEYFSKVSTFLYAQGACEIEPAQTNTHIFWIKDLRVEFLIREIERMWPDVKFVKLKAKEIETLH